MSSNAAREPENKRALSISTPDTSPNIPTHARVRVQHPAPYGTRIRLIVLKACLQAVQASINADPIGFVVSVEKNRKRRMEPKHEVLAKHYVEHTPAWAELCSTLPVSAFTGCLKADKLSLALIILVISQVLN